MKKVLVSGCFDLLHAGHIAFLKEASAYGALHVRVGSDENIKALKGKAPLFSQEERVYVLNSIDCVAEAAVSGGHGMLDFEPELEELKPEVFVVNEDGHTADKESLCRKHNVEYIVLKRIPPADFIARSSSQSKKRMDLPFRACLAGGWVDQPWVSEIHPARSWWFRSNRHIPLMTDRVWPPAHAGWPSKPGENVSPLRITSRPPKCSLPWKTHREPSISPVPRTPSVLFSQESAASTMRVNTGQGRLCLQAMRTSLPGWRASFASFLWTLAQWDMIHSGRST